MKSIAQFSLIMLISALSFTATAGGNKFKLDLSNLIPIESEGDDFETETIPLISFDGLKSIADSTMDPLMKDKVTLNVHDLKPISIEI